MRVLFLILMTICLARATPDMTAELDPLFTSGPAAGFAWSCLVTEAASGATLYRHQADRALIPASNQKLVVTAAALLALGPDYSPPTRYYADGPILEGTVHGNLVVAGFGAIAFTARHQGLQDPAAAHAQLQDQLSYFAFQLRQAGVERIRGRIITDCSHYQPNPVNAHYPCAGPLTFNENTLDIWVEDGRIRTVPDHLVSFAIMPHTKGVDQRQAPGTDTIHVNTRRDSDDYWRLATMPTPDYVASHLAHALTRRGFRIDGHDLPSGKRQLLLDQPGLSVAELLGGMNTASDNLRAELLYLHLAWKLSGQASYETGPAAFAQVFEAHDWNVPSLVAADGSGLSRDNWITATDLIYVLNRLHGSDHRDLVYHSLAIAGETGTLQKHLDTPALKGRIHAKTGTLNGVKALSGYLDTTGGKRLSFSFIANEVSDTKVWWQTIEAAATKLVDD